MLTAALLMTLTNAAETGLVPDGEVSVKRADVAITLTEYAMPERLPMDPMLRYCRMAWVGKGGAIAVEPVECHPNLIAEVKETVASWTFEVEGTPVDGKEYLEFSFIFGPVMGDEVHLGLRPAWDAEIVAMDDRFDVFEFAVTGRVFPEFPVEATGMDTTSSRCDAKVRVSATGTPEDVVVDRCDPVFQKSAEAAIRKWRFASPEFLGGPGPSMITMGVVFTKSLDPEAEGRLGTAIVKLPLKPKSSKVENFGKAKEALPDPPPNPTWPAAFKVDHKSYAEVGVYELRWPDPVAGESDRRCELLFQVNSERRVMAWPQESCPPELAAASEKAASQFNLKHGEVEPGERFARFRASFVFPADGGEVELHIPEQDLTTAVGKLPERVHTFNEGRVFRREAPKFPAGLELPGGTCRVAMTVTPKGKASEFEATECPDSVYPHAVKALKKWRWEPAREDGKAYAFETSVAIRMGKG